MAVEQHDAQVRRFGHLTVGTATAADLQALQRQVQVLGGQRLIRLPLSFPAYEDGDGGPAHGYVAVIGMQDAQSAASPTSPEPAWAQFSRGRWSEKYRCHLARSQVQAGTGHSASIYSITLPPADRQAHLHVHHHLSNLILVCADANTGPGTIAFSDGKCCIGLTLVAGDMVFVKPGVLHNLVAITRSFRFIVINDVDSDYEREDASDYHDMMAVDVASMETIRRRSGKPQLILVG